MQFGRIVWPTRPGGGCRTGRSRRDSRRGRSATNIIDFTLDQLYVPLQWEVLHRRNASVIEDLLSCSDSIVGDRLVP